MNNKIIHILKYFICLILACVILFVVAPYFNEKQANATYTAVRLTVDVPKGTLITESMIQLDENVSKNDITSNTVRDIDSIVGKYAKQDLYAYDFININELTVDDNEVLDEFYSLKEGRYLYAITIQSLASGFGTNLQKNDLVRVSYHNDEEGAVIPEILKYLRVVAVNNSYGVSRPEEVKTEELEEHLPAIVIVECNEQQMRLLTEIEYTSQIHLSLAYRGNEQQMNAYLAEMFGGE